MNIAIIQRLLPPYRIGPLDRIAREVTRSGGQVMVIHADPNPAAATAARFFQTRRVSRKQWGGAVWMRDLDAALPPECDLVIAEFSLRLLALPLLLWRCRRRGIAFLWWGSGWEEWGEAGPGPGRAARRWWRARLARQADGMIAYGAQARRFYLGLGVAPERVQVAANAVDTRAIQEVRCRLEALYPTPEAARRALDLPGKRILLFMGRLLPYKAVQRLIEAVAERTLTDLQAVIIGDGPERQRLELLATRIAPGRIHFAGAIAEVERKALYFRAADALVLPAQAGLAVNEALAFGVPVLCGSRRGPELEALNDGNNGLWVDAESGRTLTSAIATLYSTPGVLEQLRRGAESTRGHDVETMVRGYLAGIRAALTAPTEVLVLGPVPPPIHGVAVMFQTLLDHLSGDPRLRLQHLFVGEPGKGRAFGELRLRNVRVALRDIGRGAATLARLRPRVAYLSLSQNRWAFLRDAALILAAKAVGARVVAHLHGAHFGRFRGAASGPERCWIDFVLRRIDRLIVLGENLRHIAGPALPANRVCVVANGVDLPPLPTPSPVQIEPTAAKKRGCHILFMGVLDETKGFRELILALPALRARIPAVHLTLAGRWESPALRAQVEHEIKALDLQHCVTFAGVVQGAKKRALLDACDLLALPTFYPMEGLPVVILEAMAAARPVVTTARGAIPEVVTDGVTGLIVPEHDQAALVDALATLAADPSLRAAMGQRAQEVHRRHYTAAAFSQKMRRVLLGAAAAQRSAASCPISPTSRSATLPTPLPASLPATVPVRSGPAAVLETSR